MRVAIFTEVYWPMVSGVSMTMTRTADALRRRGHAVRIYSASYPLPEGAAERPEVHRSASRPLPISPEVQWARPAQAEIVEDLRRFGPDVVHLATEFAVGYAGLRAAQSIGAPIIATAHTDYERYASRYGLAWALPIGWWYLRWFYGHAARVLAPSGGYRSHLESRGVARTGIWSRGVDLDQFSPAFRSERYRRELGLGPDDLLVAYVGRIAPEKGIDRLLEAWRVVADRHPRAHLAFTGSGLMEPLIRKEALPRVHLTGVKHGFDLSVAYASADVFAMSSITETFGNVTLEAMASGVPVVGFGAGGTLELGRHEESMLLAPPERTDQFTSQLDRVLGDDSLRRRLAAGALRSAAERSWEPIFDQLLGHYHDVAAAGFASRAA